MAFIGNGPTKQPLGIEQIPSSPIGKAMLGAADEAAAFAALGAVQKFEELLQPSGVTTIDYTPPAGWRMIRITAVVIGTALSQSLVMRVSMDGVNFMVGASDYQRMMFYQQNAVLGQQDNIGLSSAYLTHGTASAGVPMQAEAQLFQSVSASHRAIMQSRASSDAYQSLFKTWFQLGTIQKLRFSLGDNATTFAAGSWILMEGF